MEQGETFEHYGSVTRVASGDEVTVSGHFRAVEERDVDGTRRWLVEDARIGTDAFEGVNPDEHRYLLPGDFTEPTPPPSE